MDRPVLDDILSDIKEEIRRRDLSGGYDANASFFVENTVRRENASWVKARKMNIRFKNSRFYFLLLPFVNSLRYLFQNSRYKSRHRVRDLKSLRDPKWK